ncbi:MAG: AMP-binding protein, partial [Myxococcales bacterium]|nr:AMP-binding protein [Myxococcales bacterium]
TNQSRWLVTAAAVFRVGGVVVPLDYKLTPADVDVLLGLARPRLLVAEHGLGRKLAWEGARLVIEAPERAELPAGHTRFEALPDAPPPPVVDRGREDPAAVVYSSGTGGTPKGCVLPHRAYLAQLEALLALYPMQPGQRFFSFLPTNHAIDFMCGFLAPFACGATVVHQRTLRAEHLRGTLQRYQITHMAAVPRLLEAFRDGVQEKLDALPAWQRLAVDGLVAANAAATERRPLPALSQNLLAPVLAGLGGKLELVFVGGAYVPPDLATFFYRIGVGVVIGYGLSEACTVVTVNDMAPFRADSVGPAVPGVEVRVLRAGADGVGDVEVRGPTLMSGYDGAPELTAAAFTEDGWLITGDRGWLDAAGHLHLVGRSRDMIVTPGGKNVYPEDVESAFDGLPVDELCVFAANYVWPARTMVGEALVAVSPEDVVFGPPAKAHGVTLTGADRPEVRVEGGTSARLGTRGTLAATPGEQEDAQLEVALARDALDRRARELWTAPPEVGTAEARPVRLVLQGRAAPDHIVLDGRPLPRASGVGTRWETGGTAWRPLLGLDLPPGPHTVEVTTWGERAERTFEADEHTVYVARDEVPAGSTWRARRRILEPWIRGGHLELRPSVGVAAIDMRALLDLSGQVDDTTFVSGSADARDTGMGSIVHLPVRGLLHGGRVWVEAEPILGLGSAGVRTVVVDDTSLVPDPGNRMVWAEGDALAGLSGGNLLRWDVGLGMITVPRLDRATDTSGPAQVGLRASGAAQVGLHTGQRWTVDGRYRVGVDPTCFDAVKPCHATLYDARVAVGKPLGHASPFLGIGYRSSTTQTAPLPGEVGVVRRNTVSTVRVLTLDVGVRAWPR